MTARRLALAAALAFAFLLGWLWLSGPADPPQATMAYTDHSYRPRTDLIACFAAGGLHQNANGDMAAPPRGLTVRIDDRHDFRKLWVWVQSGQRLAPADLTMVRRCTGRPGNR